MQERTKEDRRVETKSLEWESMTVYGLTLMQGGEKKSWRKKRMGKKRNVTGTAEPRNNKSVKTLQENFSACENGEKEQRRTESKTK